MWLSWSIVKTKRSLTIISFLLDRTPVFVFFCGAETMLYKKYKNLLWKIFSFCLEVGEIIEKNFKSESKMFRYQWCKIMFFSFSENCFKKGFKLFFFGVGGRLYVGTISFNSFITEQEGIYKVTKFSNIKERSLRLLVRIPWKLTDWAVCMKHKKSFC